DREFQNELSILLRDFAGRPTPLYHAERLTNKFAGPKIYLKREDLLHTGAHKINNALGQILLAQRMGKRRIIAETGAGQHGVATATVAARFGCECVIYMGQVDMERQALNVARIKFLGAKVVPVTAGQATLKEAANEEGQIELTHSVSAGLDYAAVGPEHSYLRDLGRVEYTYATDDEALNAFGILSETEGIIPALETAHAIAYLVKNAPKMKREQI